MIGDPRLPERFWRNVRHAEGGCWKWVGGTDRLGYGRAHVGGGKYQSAHRRAYESFVGPIPDGLVIDHLCRVRNCVNPEHLEVVTQRENVLRGSGVAAQAAAKTHCVNGHPFAGLNLTVTTDGRRVCRTCARERDRAYKARKRMAREAGEPPNVLDMP